MWGILLSLLGKGNLSPIPFIAHLLGATEPAVNLIISILMGYPIAIIYHKYVHQYKQYRHIYFIITGLDIAFFNFGLALCHNFIPAVVIYLTSMVFGPSKVNVIITFLFNMTYLLIGYMSTESEDYDITWTMPHCVLTLKLIALSFDLWDGSKMLKGEELSANNKKSAVIETPSFTELLAFIYFPSSFLVGPMFSFRRYLDFTDDKFPLMSDANVYQTLALKKLLQGILYLIAHQIGVGVFNVKFMLSDEFWQTSIIYRHFYCGLWAHFALYKYISCWLLTESSCIRIGLSFNGLETADGKTTSKWDGCNNIKLLRFEGALKFQHYIDSFNCNTNYFAAEYIYKRLKFLGNRNLSQLFTLLFLAFWHGTNSGYFMTFFNEFIIILAEREFESIISKTELYHRLWSYKVTSFLFYALLKLYTIIFMGWSLIPFDVKVYTKWWDIYASLYFSGFLVFLPWSFLYKPLLKKTIRYFNIAQVKNQ